MKALLDNDVCCKLGAAGLLNQALSALAIGIADSRRLAALPYMLKRGKLADQLGETRAAEVSKAVHHIQPISDHNTAWEQRILNAGVEIDPGEAQLLALAANDPEFLLFTGDKRALRNVCKVPGLAQAVGGRIVSLEATVIVLIKKVGEQHVSASVAGILDLDSALRSCFSSSDCITGLWSYQKSLGAEVGEDVLWKPL